MESILSTYGGDENNNDLASSSRPLDQSIDRPSFSDPGEYLFLVPLRWWEEAACVLECGVGRGVLYTATTVGLHGDDVMNIDGICGESEILVVRMRSEGEVGITGRRGKEEEIEALALVSEWMFLTALKWHYAKNVGNLPEEDIAHDLFSLRIRLLYGAETNTLVVKICGKDNEIGAFNCASKIFCSKSGTLQTWDFSGQTNQLFLDDMKQFKESEQSNEIIVELQIYGLSCSVKEEERGKEDMVVEQSMVDGPTSSSSTMTNGCMNKVNLLSASDSGYFGTFSLGLTGLNNLGNTCFMNSAIQCLVHTPKLVDYFLGNFRRDLNFENPLGMNGKLAIAFGNLLRNLWVSKATSIHPNLFKSTISNFATQFGGYSQHDSQEFLAFLLDGLHEDLNRVKSKPYVQAKDEDGRPHEEVADEYWGNHLSRNDSIIVDLCQGQYRSTLSCPDCRKSSVTFEPFMYLSLPIPSTTLRKMTLTVLSPGAATLPHQITVTVSKSGTFENLQEAVAEACSLREDETLIIAEIYNSAIYRFLDNPCDLVEKIRDSDRLVAYRLPKDDSGSPLVAFMHQHVENFPPYGFPGDFRGSHMDVHFMHRQGRNCRWHCPPSEDNDGPPMDVVMHHQGRDRRSCLPYNRLPEDDSESPMDVHFMHHMKRNRRSHYPPYGFPEDDMDMFMHHQMMRNRRHPYFPSHYQRFGIPLLTRMSDFSKGSEIREAFLKLINPFLLPDEKSSDDNIDENVNITVFDEEDAEMENQSEKDLDDMDDDFQFELLIQAHYGRKLVEIQMNKPVPITIKGEMPITVVVNWPKKMIKEYDTLLLSKLPAVCKSAFMEDSVSLYKCMEAFLKEEPLGPEDMWYCPNCKEHRQASKKLDLWRLPEILVIHLKRFSYNTSFKNNKLETLVDFPIVDFDISDYVTHKNEKVSRRYAMYAVTNHYGGMSGGHYTAFVKHGDKWYEFDDSGVAPVAEERIKTRAAYVLFYKRV